jgi:hypothetical protein
MIGQVTLVADMVASTMLIVVTSAQVCYYTSIAFEELGITQFYATSQST